jgi:hypothetical protein
MEETAATARTPLLKHNTGQTAMNLTVWDAADDVNAEFGGTAARRELEKGLLWKVDKRMSILVLIYILNFVRSLLCSAMSRRALY